MIKRCRIFKARKAAFAAALLELLIILFFLPGTGASQPQSAPPPPSPASAKARAVIDLTGYWVSIVDEDWVWRMMTPAKGDFASVPLNAEGKKVTNAWDPAKDEAAGIGDAPWPPHFRKAKGEAPRVAPSRAKMPLLVVANAAKKDEALAGLERWKTRHAEVAKLLAVDDVLVDSMRGRSSTWTRIRVNLRHVPEELRPAQETPDPDYDPASQWKKKR